MPKYTVTEVLIGSINRDIEADSEEEAIRIFESMPDDESEIVAGLEREELEVELAEGE